MKRAVWIMVMAAVMAATAWAQNEEEAQPSNWKFGGDIRLRQEAFDDLPIIVDPPGVTRGGPNNYLRFRTRLFLGYDFDPQVGVYVRVANEMREYFKPKDNKVWEAPDELLVDNIYVEIRRLLANEALSFRIGRQDLFAGPGKPFGSGRLLLEATPKDGSRTLFFDAARATYADGQTQVDLIAIYNQSDAILVINDQDRDNCGYTGAHNDAKESGVVLYASHSGIKALGLEGYYIYKREAAWDNSGRTMPSADVHTVGGRLLPDFGGGLSASLELAGQTGTRGDTDLFAYMGEGCLKYAFLQDTAAKPKLSAGVLLFSGDNAGTAHDEKWNPLWGRYPQVGLGGDLLIYTFDAEGAGWWNNLIFANIAAEIALPMSGSLKAMVGEVMSQEKNGPGGGDRRGLYAAAQVKATLAKNLVRKGDGITAHLIGELLEPGDYYGRERDMGYWARWEIMYSF